MDRAKRTDLCWTCGCDFVLAHSRSGSYFDRTLRSFVWDVVAGSSSARSSLLPKVESPVWVDMGSWAQSNSKQQARSTDQL